MSEPIWVRRETLELLHSESIAEHGGADGLRDEIALETALVQPKRLFTRGEKDFARLAARYAFALMDELPFVEGNTRIALVAACLFLRLNGCRLKADLAQTAIRVLSAASGSMDEDAFTVWLREHCDKPSLQLAMAREIAQKRKAVLKALSK